MKMFDWKRRGGQSEPKVGVSPICSIVSMFSVVNISYSNRSHWPTYGKRQGLGSDRGFLVEAMGMGKVVVQAKE